MWVFRRGINEEEQEVGRGGRGRGRAKGVNGQSSVGSGRYPVTVSNLVFDHYRELS